MNSKKDQDFDMEKFLQIIKNQQELAWINPYLLPVRMTEAVCQLVVSDAEIEAAARRLDRFAPFIKSCFPETETTNGLIESPLVPIFHMQEELSKVSDTEAADGSKVSDTVASEDVLTGVSDTVVADDSKVSDTVVADGSKVSDTVASEDVLTGVSDTVIPGKMYLKMDSHLAIAGSVKARGGIYEVLKHAEDLAIASGKFSENSDYSELAKDEWKHFFSQYTVQVGSTGNLGLSIGIMSAALGFQVKVHMSADARQWKKDLLRNKGVEVIEYADDYSRAVAEGRKLSDADPMSYFVDDEKSVNLFLGYAVAASRLKKQLEQAGILVDEEHPLIVYIPAGVGGAPGGVAYGLKRIWGDAVHCFFVEPTLCPSVLLGIATQTFEKANVHDYGIYGLTEADGLACASPSGFVTRIMTNLLSGEFTVDDTKLYQYLGMLYRSEHILIEPSSCAVFAGPAGLMKFEESRDYLKKQGLFDPDRLEKCTQIAWATGGRLVPEKVWQEYLEKAGWE